MEQSKALHQLIESADLISMVETITNSASSESVPSKALPGIKIILRTVREAILSSHDALAGDYVSRARVQAAGQAGNSAAATATLVVEKLNAAEGETGRVFSSVPAGDQSGIKMQRKDLRAALEKFIER